jgi:hypothetical protein
METIPKCKIKGCKRISEMRYYGKPLCSNCLEKYSTEELKKMLKIKEDIEGEEDYDFEDNNDRQETFEDLW